MNDNYASGRRRRTSRTCRRRPATSSLTSRVERGSVERPRPGGLIARRRTPVADASARQNGRAAFGSVLPCSRQLSPHCRAAARRLEWQGLYSHRSRLDRAQACRRGPPRRSGDRRTSSGGRSGLLQGQRAQDRPERAAPRPSSRSTWTGPSSTSAARACCSATCGRRSRRGSTPGRPRTRSFLMTGPFAGTNVSTCLAPGRGLQEPGHRHPQRQLRGRLVRARDEVRRLRPRSSSPGKAAEPTVVTIKDDVVEFLPGRAQVLGHEDLGDRGGPARRLRRRTPRCSPSARPARSSSPGPASPPTSTTRPAAAVTAPSWATRTSRPSPSAAPAR